jgi:hypothetical protein
MELQCQTVNPLGRSRVREIPENLRVIEFDLIQK